MLSGEMTFVTKSGTRIETLELAGRSTPFLLADPKNGSYGYHIRLAVDGVPCPPFWIDKLTFEREFHTLDEDEFWELRAADAMTHTQVSNARDLPVGQAGLAGEMFAEKRASL